MVAEPFIFLSKDRLVDVRCCRVNGVPYFCVKDFIRRTANQRMGPLDAVQYWISISLTLQHERDIMQSFVYKFPGPYEMPNVCLNANGLLILLHHMGEMFKLVNETYHDEVNARLQDVVDGDGDKYIEDYDDGEIDAQAKEIGDGVDQPTDSRFWYKPLVKVDGNEKECVQVDLALRMATEKNKQLQTQVAMQEGEMENVKRESEMAYEALKKRIAGLEREAEANHLKDKSFSLSMLISELGLQIPTGQTKKLHKRVAELFKTQYPKAQLIKRRHVVFFRPDDKDNVEHILRHIHLQMELRAAEKGHLINADVECRE